MARPIVLLLVLLAIAALVWFGWDRLSAPETPPSQPPRLVVTSTVDQHGLVPSTATPSAAENQRNAAAPVEESLTGSLLLTVIWADDRSPATGVRVNVAPSDGAPRAKVELFPKATRTDAKGQFLFEGLQPGDIDPIYFITAKKSGESVEVRAGQRAEATIKIEAGLSVVGRVIDSNANPIADADIVASDWASSGTSVVCRSAADGTFRTRGLPVSCHIGARKRGYGPTPMRTFTTDKGASAELTIVMDLPGGTLSGTVIGPDGNPVAGTTVRAGSVDHALRVLPDGGQGMAPKPETQKTDEQGRFLFASVTPGAVPVAARTEKLAPWQEVVEVGEGRETNITIRLQRSTTIFGVVKDSAGEPVARASVACGHHQDLGRRRTRTAVDGSFRLEGLGAGQLQVTVEHDPAGSVEKTFLVVAGEERRWDPVLAAGIELRGIVLDSDDKPVSRAMVEGQLDPWVPGTNWFGFGQTDEAGRFTFKNCLADHTIRISVRRKSTFPEMTLDGIVPSAEEVEIRLPKAAWVHITGKVLGPNDEVLSNVRASPFLMDNKNGGSPVETLDPETGAFRFGPYPPGKYRLKFAAEGFPSIRIERTVAPDETLDLGTLNFAPGGTLALQLLPGTMAMPESLRTSIFDANRRDSGLITIKNGTGRSPPLAPGDYMVTIHSNEIAPEIVKFTIRAGVETKIDVPIRPRKK